MKQGWGIKKLREVLKVQNGYAFNSKLFTTETGTPLIRIRDIKNGIGTETNFNGSYDKKYEVKAGDYLIGMDGEFGCYEWKGGKALLNQRVCRLQDFCKSLHSRFLFYGINKYLKAIEDVTAFATVKHISSKQIEAIEIPLPPLPEQQRIVAILDKAFKLIDNGKLIIERQVKNAKELFESYLKSVFENGKWESKTIQEVAKVINGYAFASNDFKSTNTIKSIKITNVGVKEFVEEVDNYLPEKFKETLKEVQVKEGNIVIALTRTIISAGLKVAVVPASYDGALVNQRVAALVPNEKIINQRYLYNFLTTDGVAKYVLTHVNTLMQPNLSINDLKNLPIPCPSLNEQNKIVQKLDALSTEAKKLEGIYQQKLLNLEELKKSILQKVFAGELKTEKVAAL